MTAPRSGPTDADLAAIRAREQAATKGPWEFEERGHPTLGYDLYGLPEGIRGAFERVEDVAFIVHAREDIPALLAERDALAAEVARLNALLRSIARVPDIDRRRAEGRD